MELFAHTGRGPVGKILFAMRLSFFMILGTALHLSAASYSQQVTIRARNLPLEKVFSLIEKQTGYNFVYNDQLIANSNVTLDMQQASLESALEACLEGKDLSYAIRYKTIIIRKAVPINTLLLPPPGYTVTGRVRDMRNMPLEGANVVLTLLHGTGQRRGTSTNENGAFVFTNIAAGDYMLEISMIGKARFRNPITVSGNLMLPPVDLKDTVMTDKEVVVNGIYQRPVANYTGAARSFTAAQLQQANPTSVLSALRSLDASFQMPSDISFGSDPNHLPQMQLRGANGVSNANLTSQYGYISNPPLFILDGFEVTLEKIFDLDMGRVKKATLLKDAAATSIYGSRAANGVVVIETVQPMPGKMRLNLGSVFGVTAPDLTSYHLLNASQKLQLEQYAGIYHSTTPATQQALNELYAQRLAEVQRGVNTYWLSQPLSTELSQKHNIYLDGGDQYMRYGVDASYNKNTGVMKGSSRQVLSGGVNLAYRKDALQFTNYLSVTSNKSVNSPYGSFSQYSTLNPYWRVTDSTGRISKILQSSASAPNNTTVYNPMYDQTLKTIDQTDYTNITENFQADWNIRPELKISARFSLQDQVHGSDVFKPADAVEFAEVPDSLFSTRGYYSKGSGKDISYQGDLYLNYGKTMGRNVLFATLGSHIQQSSSSFATTMVQGFPNASMSDILFGLQYPVNGVPTGSESTSRMLGFFANGSYAYADRYLVDASFRNDGSSQFGSERHYAPFWSTGLGWNLHKEAFLRNVKAINRLKLRASYGSTGAQNFPSYASLQTYGYLVGQRYLNHIGATLLGLGNDKLQWQQTNKLDVGADIILFRDHLSGSLDYYVEKTNDLFTQINTTPSSGFNSYYANLGNSQNRGMEVNLTGWIIRNERKNIFVSVFVTALHNVNRLTKISDALKAQNDAAVAQQKNGTVTAPVLQYQEGQSLSAIYAVRSKGIDPSTGNEIFVTKDGKQTYRWDARDEVVVGDNQAKLNSNFGTNIMYKGISLNVIMRTELGGQMYNSTLASMVDNANPYYNVDVRVLNDRWKQPGDVKPYKGLVDIYGNTRTDITNATSRFVQRNNTLYCDAINFGYLVPQSIVRHWGLSRAQAVFYIVSPFIASSIKQERGLDYPFARSYSLNLQLGF